MGIGPSTKETSLHHFRDPLLAVATADESVELVGVVVVGTPQDNANKYFLGSRVGAMLESMQVDGALVSVDGWGNSHVDFANTIEEIGKKRIPVVGLSFVGTQGNFVVTNKYMDTIVDYNKNIEGIETEIVGQNTATRLDAKKALAFLKLKIQKSNLIK